MTMQNPQTCLSAELLRQLSHDELSPAELKDVEDHVSDCERCRQLLEVPQSDSQWQDEIVQILRTPLVAGTFHVPSASGHGTWNVPATSDHDERGTEGESLESILRVLGPTDDPHMLGRIGSYEVVGVIGRGGMGVVFKAYEGALNRFVAIKMLLPHLAASGAARKRFAREGQAAAAVIDDNVMPIYSVAEWQGVPYLVTQYSRGATLQKRIQDQGPLELKEILRIGMQTARGLAAAHAQGLVHRDVKPSNILLDGTVERALLTDFGLARAVDDASITRTGIIAGTPQYMSPEQARGGSVDARSDLFGLGCVLYAMCTGRPPFRADSSYAILRMITDDEPRSIREINPDIPEWLCLLISRLMAKSPDARFGNALEVAALLEQCLAHVQQPTSVSLPASLLPHTVGHRSIFNVTRKGVLAMLGTIGMTLLGMVLMQATEAPDISGQWTSDEWGTVVLEAKQPGQYEGTFTGADKDKPTTVDLKFESPEDFAIRGRSDKTKSGTVQLKWSRVERRFNGTWGKGAARKGTMSLRLVDKEIRGGFTTDEEVQLETGTPLVGDLLWKRSVVTVPDGGNILLGGLKDSREAAKPLDRQNARAVVEAFAKAALAGDHETAKTLAKNLSSDHIADLANGLNVQRLAIQSVYVNDPTKPMTALATSEAVKLSKPNPDGQRDGFLLLTLTMSEAGWSVTDIDFESEESADRELKKFLEANPNAISVPPQASSKDAMKRTLDALVTVTFSGTIDNAGVGSTGIGWVVDDAGHILLPSHVASECDNETIVLRYANGPRCPAKRLKTSGQLTLLQSENIATVPVISLNTKVSLANGDAVSAILNGTDIVHGSITDARKTVVFSEMAGVKISPPLRFTNIISTDIKRDAASLSGAPLLTKTGDVAGMTILLREGALLAIPVAEIRMTWEQFQSTGGNVQSRNEPVEATSLVDSTTVNPAPQQKSGMPTQLPRTETDYTMLDFIRDEAYSHVEDLTSLQYAFEVKDDNGWHAQSQFFADRSRFRVNRKDVAGMLVMGKRLDPMTISSAFDGTRQQYLDSNGRLRLKNGCEGASYGIGTPHLEMYSWLRRGPGDFRWDTICDKELWKQRFAEAEYIGGMPDNGRMLEIVDFPQRLEGMKPCAYRVIFARDLRFIPIKILRRVSATTETSTTVMVTDFKSIEKGDKRFVLPTALTYTESRADGVSLKQQRTTTVAVDSLKVNEPIDEALFTIDRKDAKEEYDVDQQEALLGAARASAIEEPLDRQNARSVVDAFVAAALAGDKETTKTLTRDLPPANISSLSEFFADRKMTRLPIQSVYVNDPAKPTRALATSESVTLDAEPQPPNLEYRFSVVFTLIMGEEGWSVSDITDEEVENDRSKLKKFLEANPKAISVPPRASSETAKPATGLAEAKTVDTAPDGKPVAKPDWVVAWDFRYTLLNQRYAMMRISETGKLEAVFPERPLLRTQLSPDELSALVALVAKNPQTKSRPMAKVAEYSQAVTPRPELFDDIKKVNVRSEIAAVVQEGELLELDLNSREAHVVERQLWKLVGLAAIGGAKELPRLVDVANRELKRKFPVVSNELDPTHFSYGIVDQPSGNITIWFDFNVDSKSKDGQVVLRIPRDGQPSIEQVALPRVEKPEPEVKLPNTAVPFIEVPKVQNTVPERKLPPVDGTPVHPKLADNRYAKSGVPLAEQTWPMPPWGEEKDGLSAGLRIIGDARIGGEVKVELWVRNSSAKDVKFSQCLRADVGLNVVAKDKDGKEHSADITQFRGYPVFHQLLLPPGHIVKVKEFNVKFGAGKNDKLERRWVNLQLTPGDYKLHAKWSDTTSRGAAEGEWTGKLTTGDVDFKLAAADAGADAGKPAAKPPGATAVDRRNARSVVEAYVSAALASDVAKAAALAKNAPADPKRIAEIPKQLNVKRLAMKSVYVNDPAKPVTALATSEAVKLTKKQPDGQRDGFLVLTLTMSEIGWFVADIDFESEEGAEDELKRFREANPSAVDVPTRGVQHEDE